MSKNLGLGTHVAFSDRFEFAPHATISKGETGTIVATEEVFGEPAVKVKLDKPHRGLCEWGNTILLVGLALEALKVLAV